MRSWKRFSTTRVIYQANHSGVRFRSAWLCWWMRARRLCGTQFRGSMLPSCRGCSCSRYLVWLSRALTSWGNCLTKKANFGALVFTACAHIDYQFLNTAKAISGSILRRWLCIGLTSMVALVRGPLAQFSSWIKAPYRIMAWMSNVKWLNLSWLLLLQRLCMFDSGTNLLGEL